MIADSREIIAGSSRVRTGPAVTQGDVPRRERGARRGTKAQTLLCRGGGGPELPRLREPSCLDGAGRTPLQTLSFMEADPHRPQALGKPLY